ncbi:type II toxin-antitoxin system VapC family toxin [Methylocystis sp. L43]|uniref:type II toxin-antitoxin system VapC family toxin n=1 Tax=unclassified Methylocystis TaxID=2625913 RepID=UPI0018C314B9|nr:MULTISPECIES: type II toxin-antitoxin system VapC family toxin [unclassified Methylocystis]MBG0799034.1 type II toxin-antitoxin system VapC family toxin [Methylocystis sp. L43]MBG0806590.1 type II toxin-antitoxin system VapC family toxin [Methylocystis sp. H15]
MIGFVVDASILASFALADERQPRALAVVERLRSETALAPCLLFFQIRNVLLVSERRHRLALEDTEELLQIIARLPIAIDFDCDERRLMPLARKHRLTAYDAAYLELALREGAALATLDAELERAARAEGVAIVE